MAAGLTRARRAIVEALSARHRSVSQLAADIGRDRGNVLVSLQIMQRRGWVEQSPRSKRWRLSPTCPQPGRSSAHTSGPGSHMSSGESGRGCGSDGGHVVSVGSPVVARERPGLDALCREYPRAERGGR